MPTPTPAIVNRLQRHPSQSELDELCINTVRCLAMDGVQKAKSGHPGMPMGMAPAAYALWTRHLRHNPRNPQWVNRDRFVLSAGHGCMLLYSLLHLTGYDLSLDDLKNFRQWESKTPGHPEYGLTPGVEVTTGPLGQGIANAVGMAMAERILAHRFNREGFPVIGYRIYVIAGDGCLQEGISSEASSLAGHLGLSNLIVLYDDNRITIDGSTDLSFSEDVGRRYEAYGWLVIPVEGDGNDLAAINAAIERAKTEQNRPVLIKIQTRIGFGSPNKENSHEAHGAPLGDPEIALTKERFGWNPARSFVVPEAASAVYGQSTERGGKGEADWNALLARWEGAYPELAAEFRIAASRHLPDRWPQILSEFPGFASGNSLATREASGKFLDAVMPRLPLVIGGSADLTPSNNTKFKGAEPFTRTNHGGRYIHYGVREHAMAAIMNGMAVSGMVIPYGATFFSFADYLRPALRVAALSHYPTIFVFTHDSIGLGEDGPTHQPVEQLASLRAIPGCVVLRPADANETVVAWKIALERRDGPTALALTRQKLPVLDRSTYAPAASAEMGGYVLSDAPKPVAIFLASGSEVHTALAAQALLNKEGIATRVVNMFSWELFERQTREYRDSVLPPSIAPRVAIEAAVRQGWDRYIGPRGAFIGMTGFGASAPYEVAYEKFGITAERAAAAAREMIG